MICQTDFHPSKTHHHQMHLSSNCNIKFTVFPIHLISRSTRNSIQDCIDNRNMDISNHPPVMWPDTLYNWELIWFSWRIGPSCLFCIKYIEHAALLHILQENQIQLFTLNFKFQDPKWLLSRQMFACSYRSFIFQRRKVF
jgi:hypothetical protein